MEGQFLKMPNGQEGNQLVRKHKYLTDEKYQRIKSDWEKREVRDGVGRIYDIFGKNELKIPAHQKEIISFSVNAINEMLDERGIEGPRASVDLVKNASNDFFQMLSDINATGVCLDSLQIVAVKEAEKMTDTELADIVFHELVHLFSFQRSVLKGGDADGYPDVLKERNGIGIHSKENQNYMYYRYISEAVLVGLGLKFWDKIRESELFKKDLWLLKKKYGSNAKKHTILSLEEKTDGSTEVHSLMAYEHEYEKTMATLYHIYQANKEEFDSPEAVFDLFVKASFSGRLLPIARLIEKTYGKGMFRIIGKESA